MMKAVFISILLSWLGAICSFAHEGNPQQIRMHTMTVEVSEKDYRKMMRRKDKLTDYKYAMGLVKADKAKIGDVNIIICQPGEIARVESIREEIYPTEYKPPGSEMFPKKEGEGAVVVFPYISPIFSLLSAFETRNTGITIEIEPILGEDGKTINMKFNPETTQRLRMNTFTKKQTVHGTEEMKMPTFGTLRTDIRLTLSSGKFVLATATTPKTKDGKKDKERRVLTFVMGEVVEVKR